MLILITGVPCSGKSTILQELQKRGFETHEAKELAEKAGAIVEEIPETLLDPSHEKDPSTPPSSSSSDSSSPSPRLVKIIDDWKLADWIEEQFSQRVDPVFIASHLEGLIDATLFDKFICLQAPLPVLKERMQKRGYPSFKIQDNLQAAAMEEHRILAETTLIEQEKLPSSHLLVLDTSQLSVQECVTAILQFLHLSSSPSFTPSDH